MASSSDSYDCNQMYNSNNPTKPRHRLHHENLQGNAEQVHQDRHQKQRQNSKETLITVLSRS